MERRIVFWNPFAIQIVFDKSLKNEYVKVEGFDFKNHSDWVTIFEGKLDNYAEHSCKIVSIDSSVAFHIYINNEKFELENKKGKWLSSYKYLFVSKKGVGYKLYFSNYPQAVW